MSFTYFNLRLRILIANFLIMMCVTVAYSYGVFHVIFLDYFQITNTISSSIWTTQALISSALSPIAAIFIKKFRTIYAGLICGILVCIGIILCGFTTSYLQLYIFFGLITGMGMSIGAMLPIINISYGPKKNRTTDLGVIFSGVAVGITIWPIFSQYLINSFGWQITLMIIGTILGIIICSMSLIGSYNIKNTTGPLDPVIKNKNKTKNYNILIIGVIFTLSFALISTILTYFVSYSISLGMNSLMAASTITVIGASSLIGRLGIRFISAKINNLYLLFFIYLGQFCTFFLLLNNNVYSVFLFAIFFGIAYGSWITIIYSTITKLYSSNKLITFLGSLHLISGTISALSPIAAGYLLDIYIDFTELFLIFIIINFIILILAYLLQLKNKHKS